MSALTNITLRSLSGKDTLMLIVRARGVEMRQPDEHGALQVVGFAEGATLDQVVETAYEKGWVKG